jgi:hypothetical protein
MPIVVAGQRVEIPGLTSICYLDEPRLRLRKAEDMARRLLPEVRGIVLHTTKGIPGGADQRPQVILPGIGSPVDAGVRCARYWSTSKTAAGAHLVVDFDGTVSCCADLLLEAAFHAGPVNQVTIGIEIFQGGNAEMYAGQHEAVLTLVDWATRRFGVQRQVPDRYRGFPLTRLGFTGARGKDYFGVYGHRDVSANRGAGDPGSPIMTLLQRAGYEGADVGAYADLALWRPRQAALGIEPADGIPGPHTRDQLEMVGRPHGMWLWRPGDGPRRP